MTTPDLALLREYAQNNSGDAFAALVKRHLNLVYSAALRQVRSPQLAEEVSQSVFADLARNAPRLARDTILPAWLYQVARRTAIDVVRREARRQLREQIATEMNATNATTDDWTHIEPLLDEAMHALDDTDRAAVLLRYFENKSLQEVGEALGTSDDAAQKRVSRAVERLREFFAKRGITVGAGGLVVVISANAVQAAPAGLAITISAATIAGTTTAANAATIKTIAMTTLQKTMITAVLAAAIGTGIYESHQAHELRTRVEVLRQQQAPLAEQIQQLTHERDDLVNKLAAIRGENERLNRNGSELLKLRGMVGALRQELESLKADAGRQTAVAAHKPGSYISKDHLANAGFGTPEAAFQTLMQAMFSGNYDQTLAAMSAETSAQASDPKEREKFEKFAHEKFGSVQGIQMLAEKVIADDKVDLEVMTFEEGKAPDLQIQHMVKEGNGWKFAGSASASEDWGQAGQIQALIPTAGQ